MTDDLIEKVAKAIFHDACSGIGTPPFESVSGTWKTSARAALAAIEKAGWAVVPVRATTEMIVAGCGVEEGFDRANECYLRMLSARPRLGDAK